MANKEYKAILYKVFNVDLSLPPIKDRYPKQGKAAFAAPKWARAKYPQLYNRSRSLKRRPQRKEMAKAVREEGARYRHSLTTNGHQIRDDYGKLIDVSPRVDVPNLLKQQSILLQLLIRMDKVLRKHGIQYTISGGTLLGMHRHGGFIPWDGDVDVTVSAADFDKMADLDASEWDSASNVDNNTPNHPQIWYQTQKSDRYYNGKAAPYMAHLRWLESDYSEYKARDWHNGLQVDVMKFY